MQNNPLSVYHLFTLTLKSTIFQECYAQSYSFPHPIVKMGLKDSWPSQISIQSHSINSHHMSPCGNWLVIGGQKLSLPVYGIWNLESLDGETHVHPCGEFGCAIRVVSFCRRESRLELQTYCKCGLLCHWAPFTSPPTLLNETRFGPKMEMIWSDDGSKALIEHYPPLPGVYSLWKTCIPQQYIQLHEGDGRWAFSPGAGDKLVRYWENRLDVWDCTVVQIQFNMQFNGEIGDLRLSSDAKAIFLAAHESIHCISLEDGTTIWKRAIAIDKHCGLYLFHNDKVVVQHNSGIDIVGTLDGSTLANRYEQSPEEVEIPWVIVNVWVHPENEKVAILQRLHTHQYKITQWSPFDKNDVWRPGENVLASSEYWNFQLSWQHHVMVKASGSGICFHSINLAQPSTQRSNRSIKCLLLSPSQQYLAILCSTHIRICDTASGKEIVSYLTPITNFADNVYMNFNLNSTGLILWTHTLLYMIDIEGNSAKSFEVNKLIGATFLNSTASASIVAIESNGETYVYSRDSVSRHHICHISFELSCSSTPVISLDDTKLAMVQRGMLIVKRCIGRARASVSRLLLIVAFSLHWRKDMEQI